MTESNEIDTNIDTELEAKFLAMPGYVELVEKRIKFDELSLKSTLRLMKTAAYCHLDAAELVERFVWLCGGSKPLFYKYFTDEGLANGIDPIVRDLLIERHYDEHNDAEIGVRFRWINLFDAVSCGNLKLLKYAYDHKPDEFKDPNLLCTAAESSHRNAPKCIKFLRRAGCPWSSEVAVGAIEEDLIDNFAAIHEAGLIVDPDTIADGIMHDAIKCIRYAHEKKIEFPADAINLTLSSNSPNCLKFLHSKGWEIPANSLDQALMHNSKSCAEYLLELKYAVSSDVISHLIEKDAGSGIIMLAHAGVKFETYHVMKAIMLRRFKLVGVMGAADFTLFIEPIVSENVEVMQRLLELKCPMDIALCNIAAQLGRLRALKFLHESGCSWDATTYIVAMGDDVRKYLRDSGCPQPGN